MTSYSASTANQVSRSGTRGGHQSHQQAVASLSAQRARASGGNCDAGWTQRLMLMLNGITADDYLTWIRDPEPLALGMSLRSVAVSAAPIGDRIEVELCWDDTPPPIRFAAIAAGFPLIPEVTLPRGALDLCAPTLTSPDTALDAGPPSTSKEQ